LIFNPLRRIKNQKSKILKMKKYFIAVIILTLIMSINFSFAYMGGGMMSDFGNRNYSMMTWDGMGGGLGILTMILAVIFWVIFWAIVIVAIIALVKWLYMKFFRGELWILGKREMPEDILKLRYAKGDISKEQYEVMRKEIMK